LPILTSGPIIAVFAITSIPYYSLSTSIALKSACAASLSST